MKWPISFILMFILTFSNAQEKLSETLNYKDITYKIKDTAQQKLDMYLPQKTNKKSPVLVFVHGGGWAQGDKGLRDDYYLSDFVLRFVKQGYAVVSINYTLLNEKTHFPTPIEDTKEANAGFVQMPKYIILILIILEFGALRLAHRLV